jgi:hypothetical protein
VWHRGETSSKMNFHWDPGTLIHCGQGRATGQLDNLPTLQDSSHREADSLLPAPRRALKGGDDQTHTHVPTVSPAPTLAVSNSLNWRVMTLHATTASPWFDSLHQGTEFYISDPHGHHLITSGTICPGETERQC